MTIHTQRDEYGVVHRLYDPTCDNQAELNVGVGVHVVPDAPDIPILQINLCNRDEGNEINIAVSLADLDVVMRERGWSLHRLPHDAAYRERT